MGKLCVFLYFDYNNHSSDTDVYGISEIIWTE